MVNPNAPYAQAAALLNERLMEYQLTVLKRRNMTLEDIRRVLGVESVSAVKYWLDGMRRPRREMAVQIGERLGLADPFAIAEAYGYERATDDSAVTIPELIEFVANHPTISSDTKTLLIDRLRRAQSPADAYEAETIAGMLRRQWPLEVRARQIAAYADMAASTHILHVA